jgi:hypothetical protein
MSPDHRRRPRERPPDQKRERGPAGDRTADLKNTDNNNSNALSYNLSERRAQENRRLRRHRLINAAVQKHGVLGVGVLLRGLEEDCGDLAIDRRLERIVDQDPRAIALLDFVGGAR